MSAFQTTFKPKEVKYILSDDQYNELMKRLEGIAKIDDYGLTKINNIYFDTPDLALIRRSLEKPRYKEKLRLRTYGVPTDETNAFIEIKKKYDGIVYKRRINMTYKEAIDYLIHGYPVPKRSQISDEIDYFMVFYRNILPAMKISYDRIAMAGINDPSLRITFDTNLQWSMDLDLRNGTEGRQILLPGQHLMELKVPGAMNMEMASILNDLGIFQTSFSKYGRGYQTFETEQIAKGIGLSQQMPLMEENARKCFARKFTDYEQRTNNMKAARKAEGEMRYA